MPSSHVSAPQMCRPHFHAPLPWSLSDPPKPLTSGSAWGSPFACPQDPQDSKLVNQLQNSQSSSGQHLFSFPPTPPKDSTPDSVQTGPTAEYQAAVNVFMHQAQQASSNSQLNGNDTSSNCGLDVKPCLSGAGNGNGQSSQQGPKQREGTHNNASANQSQSTNSQNNTSSNNSNSSSQNLNNHSNASAAVHNGNAGGNSAPSNAHHQQHSALNGSLFDAASHQTSSSSYGAYESGYLGYPQSTNSVFQSNMRSSTMNSNSPSSNHKPQRTKARTSAGKNKTRCWDSDYYFLYPKLYFFNFISFTTRKLCCFCVIYHFFHSFHSFSYTIMSSVLLFSVLL